MFYTFSDWSFSSDKDSKGNCGVKVGTRNIRKRVDQSHTAKGGGESTKHKIFRDFLTSIIDGNSLDDKEEEEGDKPLTENSSQQLPLTRENVI